MCVFEFDNSPNLQFSFVIFSETTFQFHHNVPSTIYDCFSIDRKAMWNFWNPFTVAPITVCSSKIINYYEANSFLVPDKNLKINILSIQCIFYQNLFCKKKKRNKKINNNKMYFKTTFSILLLIINNNCS